MKLDYPKSVLAISIVVLFNLILICGFYLSKSKFDYNRRILERIGMDLVSSLGEAAVFYDHVDLSDSQRVELQDAILSSIRHINHFEKLYGPKTRISTAKILIRELEFLKNIIEKRKLKRRI